MRLPEHAGLRRDLLVCALWRQIPHVGFMVTTDAARRVGIRDREEVGLAANVDFTIRLAQAYPGHASVFLDRAIVQTRTSPTGLSHTALDVACKLYDVVAATATEGFSSEELLARDRLLARIGPAALREHSVSRWRRAALRVLLSRSFPHRGNLIRLAYSLGLIALPGLVSALNAKRKPSRRLANNPASRGGPAAAPDQFPRPSPAVSDTV